jgi:hypothetical protein
MQKTESEKIYITHKVAEARGRKQIVQACFAISVVGYSSDGVGRLGVDDVEVTYADHTHTSRHEEPA